MKRLLLLTFILPIICVSSQSYTQLDTSRSSILYQCCPAYKWRSHVPYERLVNVHDTGHVEYVVDATGWQRIYNDGSMYPVAIRARPEKPAPPIVVQSPVSWSFYVKKLKDKQFEVHMTANIQSGWHLYSQVQPKEAIAIPTSFTVNKNPLFSKTVGFDERGRLERFKDTKLGIAANQYSNSVDFVIIVELKTKVLTNMAGTIEYQTCDDEKCLPPQKQSFNVMLQ